VSTAGLRAVAWLVCVAGLAIHVFATRTAEGRALDRVDVALLCLPHTLAALAVLVLGWIGPFPPTWPVVGRHGRAQRVIAGIVAALYLPALLFFWLSVVLGVV
jgi:hypothetical protein